MGKRSLEQSLTDERRISQTGRPESREQILAGFDWQTGHKSSH